MMQRALLFVGGNGHSAARLIAARDSLAALEGAPPFTLEDAALPGFEGRPRPASLDALLDAVAGPMAACAASGGLVYATGIGALLALAARARLPTPLPPLLLQGPVLWGLRARWMPRLMRLSAVRAVALRLFASTRFQRRFWRTKTDLPWEHPLRAPFFEGYARCPAFADLFHWITPSWLRRLEDALRARAEALAGVRVWWGGRDPVVGIAELRVTEQALGVSWPLRVFPAWAHYPMLDDPGGWVRALAAEMDEADPA
jgi:hypothetical protein